jgi:hypothetical protein
MDWDNIEDNWWYFAKWAFSKKKGYVEAEEKIRKLFHDITQKNEHYGMIEQMKKYYDNISDDQYKSFKKWYDESADVREDEKGAESSMVLVDKNLIKRETWLVHFTNDAIGIQNEGFKYGHPTWKGLHLSVFSKTRKKQPGYNFAFIADSKDAEIAYRNKKYGNEFVMFQSSGVHAWHAGDDENQVIFYGPDTETKSIVACVPVKDDEYEIYQPNDKKVNIPSGNFNKISNWVINNYSQYRKYITRYK